MGVLVMHGAQVIAVALAIVTLALLAHKQAIKSFRAQLKPRDLRATLKLLVISFIILPVLPKASLDQYLMFQVGSVQSMDAAGGRAPFEWLGAACDGSPATPPGTPGRLACQMPVCFTKNSKRGSWYRRIHHANQAADNSCRPHWIDGSPFGVFLPCQRIRRRHLSGGQRRHRGEERIRRVLSHRRMGPRGRDTWMRHAGTTESDRPQGGSCAWSSDTRLRLMRSELGEKCYKEENRWFRQAAHRLAGARDAEALLETWDKLAKHYPEMADAPCVNCAGALSNTGNTSSRNWSTCPARRGNWPDYWNGRRSVSMAGDSRRRASRPWSRSWRRVTGAAAGPSGRRSQTRMTNVFTNGASGSRTTGIIPVCCSGSGPSTWTSASTS